MVNKITKEMSKRVRKKLKRPLTIKFIALGFFILYELTWVGAKEKKLFIEE